MKRVASIVMCLAALTACQQESVPPPAATPAPAATPTAAPPAVVAADNHRLKLEPSSLPACEPGSVVKVIWDATDLTTSTDLQLWVVAGGQEKLFASGGASGDATTGAWSRPGTIFRLKTAGDGSVVAEAVVDGPSC